MREMKRLKKLLFKIKDYDRIEYDYGCVLCHATVQRMSYTNYDRETIYSVIDDAQEKKHMDYIGDDIINILEDGGTIEDIKKYFNK